ncbi:MAG: tyrosinase family protein, partial [Methylococcales bacterium]
EKNPHAVPGSSAGLGSGPAVDAVNLEATLPDHEPDCWPSGEPGSARNGASRSRKRSDLSALIIGLRGEYPFNGSIFPPLLWNAARKVSKSEIAFIAEWIDNGCPVEDVEADTDAQHPKGPARISVATDEIRAMACGDMAHPVSGQSTNQSSGDRKGLRVRKEVSTLTPEELGRLREALSCMYQYNGYWLDERSFDYWARIHTDSCQHGWEQFLPWHRLYLYFFEQTLQDYDPFITLPYWSWTDYAAINRDTYQTEKPDQGVIPDAYHCWLDDIAVEHLKATGLYSEQQIARFEQLARSAVSYNSGLRLLSTVDVPYTLARDPKSGEAVWADPVRAIYNELRRANPLWFPNRWPGVLTSPTHYPTQVNLDQLLAINNWADFGGGPEYDHHFGGLEELHNGMHNFAGGINPYFDEARKVGIDSPDPQNFENPQNGWMTDNRVTAYDPIFWAHHSNVDRVWALWQELHPNSNPEELDGSLPPWSLTVRNSLSIRKLGYEYMRDSYHYPTTRGVPMMRFKGARVGVGQRVLDFHRKAEIRLHRVRRANLMNCSIRVFLNQDDADASTPVVGNAHFVGEVWTFHGSCYGGPGHCALPLERSRGNDQRPLHHHEPRNFRIDASRCLRELMRQGASDFSVHLVVVGLDGKAMDNALFIDGVSLNFMD